MYSNTKEVSSRKNYFHQAIATTNYDFRVSPVAEVVRLLLTLLLKQYFKDFLYSYEFSYSKIESGKSTKRLKIVANRDQIAIGVRTISVALRSAKVALIRGAKGDNGTVIFRTILEQFAKIQMVTIANEWTIATVGNADSFQHNAGRHVESSRCLHR